MTEKEIKMEQHKNILGIPVDINKYATKYHIDYDNVKNSHPKVVAACSTEDGTIIAKPKGYVWAYIGDLNRYSPILQQDSIVAEGTSEERINRMCESMKSNKWEAAEFPPVASLDRTDARYPRPIKYGTGRCRTASLTTFNQKWEPVLEIEYIDNTLSTYLAQNLLLNLFNLPSVDLNKESFILTGYEAVKSGGLEVDKDSIRDWLLKSGIKRRWPDNDGLITEVVNKIYVMSATQGSVCTKPRASEEVKQWYTNFNYEMEDDSEILCYCAESSAYQFVQDHIMKPWSSNKIEEVILYSKKDTAVSAADSVKKFLDKVDGLCETIRLATNNILEKSDGNGNELTSSNTTKLKEGAYQTSLKILGVYPSMNQGNQKDMREQGKLVSVETFIQNGSSVQKDIQHKEFKKQMDKLGLDI